MSKKLFLLFFASLILNFAWGEKNLSFQAQVSPKTVKIGQIFTYRIVLKSTGSYAPAIIPPQFKNFVLVSQSSQQNYVLEGAKAKLTFVLQLRLAAKKEGEFTLPPAQAKCCGQTFKSPLVKIKVKGRLKTKTTPPKPSLPLDLSGSVSI